MQGKNRVAVPWGELEPYIETVHVVHPAGGSRHFRLYLVSRNTKEDIVMLANGFLLSEQDAAENYRFLSDYMDGDWGALPKEIVISESIYPSFWKRAKLSAMVYAPNLDDPLWKKWIYSVLSILSRVLQWPFEAPNMASSLLDKAPPEFSQADLDAAYWDGSNPPMPEALAKRIKSMEPDRLEKAVYGTGLVIGALIWVPFLIWLTWKLATL